MPLITVELNANQQTVRLPIIWRLGRLFNVVTNVLRARVTEDSAYITLELEGSTQEVEQTLGYLRSLGLTRETGDALVPASVRAPEETVSQANAIYVRLTTVNPAQNRVPVLYRVGKDFNVVVNIERAAFDDEEGGSVDVTLSGPLGEIQRAIAYLHTTGLHVNPRQRSVTDYGNL
jgi:hypothetical protein